MKYAYLETNQARVKISFKYTVFCFIVVSWTEVYILHYI